MGAPRWLSGVRSIHVVSVLAVGAALPLLDASPARADLRRFTYIYETTTMPRGGVEYEQWVTWQTDKRSDGRFERLDFRHELEFGVTDRLQLALYFPDWRWTRSAGGERTFVHDTAIEAIYQLASPLDSPLGVALYGEVKLDGELLALEAKLLLEKDWGPWIFAYNAVVEGEWEGQEWEEDGGELKQLLGASYRLAPRLFAGAELMHEVGLPDWSETGESLFYAGPNAGFLADRWWVTVTPLVQLTDEPEEPDLMLRTLVGVLF